MFNPPSSPGTATIAEMASYAATPIARQMLRLIRSEPGTSDEFNAATYLAEVLLKYETVCAISVLERLDADDAATTAHNLVLKESLGQWRDTLQKAVSAMTAIGTPDSLPFTRSLTKRLDDSDTASKTLVEQALLVWNELGQADFRITKTRLGLFEFFVALRNRTRGHGAPLQRQFEAINGTVIRLLEILCRDSPFLWQRLLSPIKLKKGDTYSCRFLCGSTPQEHFNLPSEKISSSEHLYLDLDGGIFRLPDFLRYHKDDDGCFFLNSPRKKNGKFDFLDYFSNREITTDVVAFAAPPRPKPKSATAGFEQLNTDDWPAHNLPLVDFINYVPRPELESELLRMLTGKTMNVVSLGGEGGIGKTTLALRVSRKLLASETERDPSQTEFDYIIWFSARDVDLHDELGPQRRERQVSSLSSAARFFRSLLASVEPVPDGMSDEDYFAHALGSGSYKFLLIFDNFESFDDVAALQEFISNNLAFPSKVLITSRERNFEGDRQLRVPGLSLDQTRDLIARTSRQVGCEPAALNENVVASVHSRTSGNPYAVKLVITEIARGTPIERIFQVALNEKYLTTLFRRSFERVEEGAQYLFLMICLSETARREEIAGLLCVGRNYDYSSARDSLIRNSLLDLPVRWEEGTTYRVSWSAQEFAKQSLVGVHSQRYIENDLRFVHDLELRGIVGKPLLVLEEYLEKVVENKDPHLSPERNTRLVSYIASVDAASSARRAIGLANAGTADPFTVRSALKTAVELDSSNAELWYVWSKYEEQQSDYRRALDLALRAVDYGETVELLVETGKQITHLLSLAKDQIQPHLRRIYTGSIIDRLHRFKDDLTPQKLCDLGWLQLVSFDFDGAAASANAALAIDPGYRRAQDLLQKATR